jgi:signal-transduction protein with cAMP-binding, CBS, and nucleotidyltransferase domain
MKGYKLIVDKRNDKNIFELYNLIDDRGEQKNIAAEKPAILQELFKRIMDLREQNKKRLEKNIAKIDKSVELDAEWQKTMEELKALGYI